MKRYDSPEHLPNFRETVVALGTFDGIHKGHQALIRKATEDAAASGRASLVFSFCNHPRNVIAGRTEVKSLLSPEEKEALLRELGVDYLVLWPFDRAFMQKTPETFVQEFLLDRFGAKEVCCGFDYRFGIGGSGTPELLQTLGARSGFDTFVLPPYEVDGRPISSTLLRNAVEQGEVEQYLNYTGRNYSLSGEVVSGNRIGRTIGFPTMNLDVDETRVMPRSGVYVTTCELRGTVYSSVTNVGYKPTVGSPVRTVETNLFGFHEECYGETIRVSFLTQLREEMKFETIDALAAQIQADRRCAAMRHGIVDEK